MMHEELSTYADEVFESPSEAAMKEVEPSSKMDETELTGSALDKTELERSHLMLWVTGPRISYNEDIYIMKKVYIYIYLMSSYFCRTLPPLLLRPDLLSVGGAKPKKELQARRRCPCGRRWWALTDSDAGSALWCLSRSFSLEKRDLMGWAWWGSSQTAPTASALTATSRGR